VDERLALAGLRLAALLNEVLGSGRLAIDWRRIDEVSQTIMSVTLERRLRLPCLFDQL